MTSLVTTVSGSLRPPTSRAGLGRASLSCVPPTAQRSDARPGHEPMSWISWKSGFRPCRRRTAPGRRQPRSRSRVVLMLKFPRVSGAVSPPTQRGGEGEDEHSERRAAPHGRAPARPAHGPRRQRAAREIWDSAPARATAPREPARSRRARDGSSRRGRRAARPRAQAERLSHGDLRLAARPSCRAPTRERRRCRGRAHRLLLRARSSASGSRRS